MHAEKANKYSRKVSNRIVYTPVLIVLAVIVILVSGILKYKLIAIGSNSMKPIYEKGDAIIYKKLDDLREIEVGDIIAFEKNNIIVTHRVISHDNDIYKTKGDNNDSADYFDVTPPDILGKVEYEIKYIGYPTLWIKSFLRRGEINYED